MRGFLVGSLALIALYALLQRNAAAGVEAGGNALVSGMRRLLSPDVAGVPQRGGQTQTPTAAPVPNSPPLPGMRTT